MAHGLDAIDWAVPWLEPWRHRGQQGAQWVQQGSTCAEALNQLARSVQLNAVQFVDQAALPVGQAYEAFIDQTRQVPTRNGLHDFFNGLCWLQFPRTKRRLNQLQAAQIGQEGITPVRGTVRDALTVFDENAALMQAPDALWSALDAKDWALLFGALRPQWSQVRLLLFGHALLEKLVQPRKAITAHVYRVPEGLADWHAIDPWLAEDLTAQKIAAKPFAPLPVLGVPGWCHANHAAAFYDDIKVFRAVKAHKMDVRLHQQS